MVFLAVLVLAATLMAVIYAYRYSSHSRPLSILPGSLKEDEIVPVSVNYFFTRKCNAECKFCFHTETSSYKLPLQDAEYGLRLLAAAGMKKINFAGGEPFLYPKYLGSLCRYCKEDLGLESVSIVSNGTKVTGKWLKDYGSAVDILAISCDSTNPETNKAIGRRDRGSGEAFDNVKSLFQIKEWCQQYGIRFKLNTVVCSLNWEESMADMVQKLDPFRWKVFQVLVVVGENESDIRRKRDATKFVITDAQYEDFCNRHKHLKCMIPEPNKAMKSSYLLIDEYMRFLDKGDGDEKVSESILEVGVQKAIKQVRWDQEEFHNRGGIYDWDSAAEKMNSCGGRSGDKKLEW
ncbi:Radical S-adenosyl methionine domain-containing protein [Lachnellula occidentalis]|uniref:Radical S-adenosyl methionine domain-containing protein n=1 Tax=Lachnellula occidentalis TaxID=215460 RepID=A0A8H8S5G0_9HELO|nr:Radical S-adenosyl methionine domain-containing protein [Lachnellula occidentalis]